MSTGRMYIPKPRMKVIRKPSRKILLRVISELQDYIGIIDSYFGDDRNPFRGDNVLSHCKEAFELCLDATQFDDPRSYEETPPTNGGEQ